MANNNLMFRIGDFSYSREVGMAMILSRTLFTKELTFPEDKKQQKESLWNRWFGSKKAPNQLNVQQQKREKNPKVGPRKLSEEIQISETSSVQSKTRVRKSLKPTPEMLKKLELNFGVNTITYKVKTQL
jgi:ribosome assembly protein YihI (activator of Der GTPase)